MRHQIELKPRKISGSVIIWGLGKISKSKKTREGERERAKVLGFGKILGSTLNMGHGMFQARAKKGLVAKERKREKEQKEKC